MKFITEMELRDLYKTEPFATYVLEADTKLTPGARQFLVDRRVTLAQAQCSDSKQSTISEPKQAQGRENWCTLRLRGRMDCIASLFLLIAAELLGCKDAVLSEEIMALGKYFRNIQKAEQEQIAPDKIQFWGWSEEEIKNRTANLEKYFDISEFHVGLENGKAVALLNHLRASLCEVEPAILETYWNEEQQVCSREDLIATVNLIINILCMMMWKCLGGQKWKR
jgi:ethanolamine utilization cobalamin adenosyltransferase